LIAPCPIMHTPLSQAVRPTDDSVDVDDPTRSVLI
jgi:hypothetical protein